jgi:hypothetical protein
LATYLICKTMDSDVRSNSLIHALKKESTQSRNSFIHSKSISSWKLLGSQKLDIEEV